MTERTENGKKGEETLALLSHVPELALPLGKSERRMLAAAFTLATPQKPVRFYVGSCPDYANNGSHYTHEGLGEGVPLLTQQHVIVDSRALHVLRDMEVAAEMVVMVADVEAVDEVFCTRFTQGSEHEFLRRCRKSVEATRREFKNLGADKVMKSSSFFDEFGRNTFMAYQEKYQKLVGERYHQDHSFQSRVTGDLLMRMEMYSKMYPGIGREMKREEREEFLVGRTLRTMAQYLTLGRLIGLKGDECYPVIISHPTRNKGVFNERNRFVLPEDGNRPQPTIPVLEMQRRVY